MSESVVPPACPSPSSGGAEEAVACLRAAAKGLRGLARDDIPTGAEHALGEDLIAVLAALDEVKLAAADAAALFQARGGLNGSGQRSLAHWLQYSADRAPGEATQLASLAHRPPYVEESEQAYDRKEISLARYERVCFWVNEALHARSHTRWPQAEAFAHAAEAPLLWLATEPASTIRGLNHAGRRLRYMCDPAGHEKEYQDRYAGRGAVFTRGMDNSFHLEAWGDEAAGDVVRKALDAVLCPPGQGQERTTAQRTHDALVDLCSTVLELPADHAPRRAAGAAPVTVVVGLDLLRGEQGAAPAVSEYGTLWPASAARAQAADCRLTRLVVDPMDGRPLDVGRSRRLFGSAVRTAVMAQRQTCAWRGGCDRPIAWCQLDHKQAWWDGGASDVANAQPLCRFHNLEKEHRRARERGWGQRPRRSRRHPPPPGSRASDEWRPGHGARPVVGDGGQGGDPAGGPGCDPHEGSGSDSS